MAKRELEFVTRDLLELKSILRSYFQAPLLGPSARTSAQNQAQLTTLQDNWITYGANVKIWIHIVQATSNHQYSGNTMTVVEHLNMFLDIPAKETTRSDTATRSLERRSEYQKALITLQKGLPEPTRSKDKETGPLQILERFERRLISVGLPKEQAQVARKSAEESMMVEPGRSRPLAVRSAQCRVLCVDKSQGSKSPVGMITPILWKQLTMTFSPSYPCTDLSRDFPSSDRQRIWASSLQKRSVGRI